MQVMKMEVSIFKKEDFEEEILIKKLQDNLSDTGYKIVSFRIENDYTPIGEMHRKLGQSPFMLIYEVKGRNLDHRQISGGLFITRDELDTFKINGITPSIG